MRFVPVVLLPFPLQDPLDRKQGIVLASADYISLVWLGWQLPVRG